MKPAGDTAKNFKSQTPAVSPGKMYNDSLKLILINLVSNKAVKTPSMPD